MRGVRRFLGLGLVAGTLTLTGCAGAFSNGPAFGPGLQFGITPSGSLSLAPCSLIGTPGVGPGLTGSASAAAMAMARMQQIQQVTARYSLASSDVRAKNARYMMAAEAGC